MGKRVLRGGITGILVGISLDYLTLIVMSYVLRLGYFAPCLTTLRERAGGEMNAVLVQLAVCAWLGLGLGIAWAVGGNNGRSKAFRVVCAAVCALAALIPFLMLAYALLFSHGNLIF